jgi:hypothetical protein
VSTVQEIKGAIERLSFEQRAELAAWLHGWRDDDWDKQMKRDVAEGKLDRIAEQADRDFEVGRCAPF